MDTQYQAYQRIYDDTFTHLYELTQTKLMDTVTIDTNLPGMTKVYNQMGKLTAVDKTAKHQTIDPQEAEHSARHLTVLTKFVPAIVDKEQALNMIKDPTSDIYQEAVAALKRKQTQVLMESFFSDVVINEDGGSTYAFQYANQIAVNYNGGLFGQNSGAANVSLNIDKLMAVRKKLSAAEIMINDSEQSKLHIAVTEEEVQKLMASLIGTDNYPLLDSNFESMKLSLDKAVDSINDNQFYWKGFHFHILAPQYFSLDASGHRRIPVWMKSGMVYGIKENMKSTIADLPNTVESMKIQVLTRVGGLRKHDAKVHEIKCVVA